MPYAKTFSNKEFCMGGSKQKIVLYGAARYSTVLYWVVICSTGNQQTVLYQVVIK